MSPYTFGDAMLGMVAILIIVWLVMSTLDLFDGGWPDDDDLTGA